VWEERCQKGQIERRLEGNEIYLLWANSARRAIQIRPSFSVAYWLLAASLAKLERLDQAKAAAAPKENQAHSQSAPD
jgi:hypothetical protein